MYWKPADKHEPGSKLSSVLLELRDLAARFWVRRLGGGEGGAKEERVDEIWGGAWCLEIFI